MQTIKAACFNRVNYCKYPDGIHNIKEFVAYLNLNYHSFVALEMLEEENCVAPFFITDQTPIKLEYWNPMHMRCVNEAEIYMLSKAEYDERLLKVISEKCVHCAHYSEDACEQDYQSHREHISLNGECFGFEKQKTIR